MWILIPLCISLIGILTLFAIKYWEKTRGSAPGITIRSRFDAEIRAVNRYVRTTIPHLLQQAEFWLKHTLVAFVKSLLSVLHFTERKLIRIINLVKGTRNLDNARGSASDFLQNVASYKKQEPIRN